MVENREEMRTAPPQPPREPRPRDEISGVHRAPWPSGVQLAPESARDGGGWGTWGEDLARTLVAEVGARVLCRFPRLTRTDTTEILEAVGERLVRVGPPWSSVASPPRPTDLGPRPGATGGGIEAHVRRAVFIEALPFDRRRWIEEIRADPDEARRELERAARRAAALTGRERSLFRAACILDDVAEEEEVGKVVLHAAVAFQMRWNTAHQHLSRAWRKIGEGTRFTAWGTEWRAGHRLFAGPPAAEHWAAGRSYLDACSGRGAHGGPAFDAWSGAHEDHNAWFNEWKKQSTSATQRWRAFVARLDASGVRPRALCAELVSGCAELGIDRWVIPAKVAQQSWRDLLGEASRPAIEARSAWRDFLRQHAFGPEAEAALRDLEREAALAEVAGVELEHAYHRLLAAAEQRPGDGARAKNEFRSLVDAL